MTRFPTYAELRSRAKAFRERSATNRFIIVCALVFAAQALGLFFAEAFALNPFWVRSGCLLNFLSYGFLHGGFWHLALNMLALYFAGNAVERYDSGGNATAVFLGGIAVGGLAWLGVVEAVAAAPAPGAMSPHTLVGASAGVAARFSYFSVAHRDSELRAMLFFVLPVRMPAWALFAAIAGISLLGLVFSEIPSLSGGASGGSGPHIVAHSAHLGGALFGAGYALAAERLRKRFGNVCRFRR